MNFKRWYDIDVTMSRAVALWEGAEENLQTVCADYVIDKLKDMDFEMYWDGACSAERILEFAPKGMKGFVLGTTLLFGKDRPYGEILRDIRDLRL